MKKVIVFLMMVTAFVFNNNLVEAKTAVKSKGDTRSSKTTAKKGGSSQSSPQGTYAIFRDIPYNGKMLSLSDFYSKNLDYYDIKPGSKIKELNITDHGGIDVFDENFRFDSDGKLISYKYITNMNYADMELEFIYDDQGRLIKQIWNEEDSFDNCYEPLVNRIYEYKWDNGKVVEITETIKVDNGINYNGKTTHLDLYYDNNNKLTKAVCRERPEVKYEFNSEGEVTNYNCYECKYKNDVDSSKWHTIKRPLNWDFSYTVGSQMPSLNNTLFNFNTPDDYIFKYDENGNWTKAQEKEYEMYHIDREIKYW